jgi:hypothetical protein
MLTSLVRFFTVTKPVFTGFGLDQLRTGLNRFFAIVYTQNNIYLTISITV